MTRIFSSVIIQQPLERVFEYVTTPGNWPRWHRSSLAVTGATNHSLEIGEQVTEEFLVAGRLGRAVWTVVERAVPTCWVIQGRIVGSQQGGRVSYRLSRQATGATLLERELIYELRNPWQRLMDRLFVRARVEHESSQAVNLLRERLEERAAASSTIRESL
ncbi:MAG: SRPBCC family protein [Chloroflexota bacterium]